MIYTVNQLHHWLDTSVNGLVNKLLRDQRSLFRLGRSLVRRPLPHGYFLVIHLVNLGVCTALRLGNEHITPDNYTSHAAAENKISLRSQVGRPGRGQLRNSKRRNNGGGLRTGDGVRHSVTT